MYIEKWVKIIIFKLLHPNSTPIINIIILSMLLLLSILLIKKIIVNEKQCESSLSNDKEDKESYDSLYYLIEKIYKNYSSLFAIKKFLKNYKKLINYHNKNNLNISLYRKAFYFYPKRVLEYLTKYNNINTNSITGKDVDAFILEFHTMMKELNSYYDDLIEKIENKILKKETKVIYNKNIMDEIHSDIDLL